MEEITLKGSGNNFGKMVQASGLRRYCGKIATYG